MDAVEEIIAGASPKLDPLRELLKRLPDLAKGLCRVQYGQVGLRCFILNYLLQLSLVYATRTVSTLART